MLAVAVTLGIAVSGRAQTPEPPRTAWGDPDLGGVWDYSSLTPMARPPEFEGKPVLTEEEAAEYLRQQTQFYEALDDGSTVPGNEIHTRVFIDAGTTLVLDRRSSLIVDPPTGRQPALVDGAAARMAANPSSFSQGPFESHRDFGLTDRCLASIGFPIVPGPYNNNIQIFQTPDHVAILAESMSMVRIIPLDGRAGLPEHLRQWNGDARAHWDGDTLVVETARFVGQEFNLIPHGGGGAGTYSGASRELRLTERFTRLSDDFIEYEFTIDDPGLYTRPWTGVIPLTTIESPDTIIEYACHEGNYSIVGSLSGALARDRAASQD
ncbi:MAG TPA: hypothetical protein DCR10_03330 [Acidimicrobiaceae bacterium]|nr:hypothetical protein [Acidimicrobiaceae bacterium]